MQVAPLTIALVTVVASASNRTALARFFVDYLFKKSTKCVNFKPHNLVLLLFEKHNAIYSLHLAIWAFGFVF